MYQVIDYKVCYIKKRTWSKVYIQVLKPIYKDIGKAKARPKLYSEKHRREKYEG